MNLPTMDRAEFDFTFVDSADSCEAKVLGVNATLSDFIPYFEHLREEDLRDFVNSLVHMGVFKSTADAEARRDSWGLLWIMFIQWGFSVGRQVKDTPLFILKRIPFDNVEFVVFIGSKHLSKNLKKVLPPVKRHINGIHAQGKTMCTTINRENKAAVRFAEYLGFRKIEDGLEDGYDYYAYFSDNS